MSTTHGAGHGLLSAIETFLTDSGMSAPEFGRQAMKDPNFVYELRAGRDVKLATVDRLQKFMARHKPRTTKGTGNGKGKGQGKARRRG